MSGPTIQDRRRAPARDRAAVVRLDGTVPVRWFGFSFRAEPVRVVQARRRLTAVLVSMWGDGGEADDAALVASEILTNGCRYGSSYIWVRARISSQSMTLKASTPASWNAQEALPVEADAQAEGGRGLEIVRALAESVRITPDVDGSGASVIVLCRAEPPQAVVAQQGGVV